MSVKTGLSSLYIVGVPGTIGGASTKLRHLVRLLNEDFKITVIAPEPWVIKNPCVKATLAPYGIDCKLLKDLPKKLEGVALGVCDGGFFSSGRARELKCRGLKVVWSNEMMWPFKDEAEAAKEGLVDRVLFVSTFQAKEFDNIYRGVPSSIVGNYIDPGDYAWRERAHLVFTMGRLSRPDPMKYPLDFPVFYEEMGLKEVRYRVMAWSVELQKQYRWHVFGPEWDLLPANKQSTLMFLYSLDVMLYPLGHRVKESWGRAVVEAMLTGVVPVVPTGHNFHNLMVHGESGFICKDFSQFKDAIGELYSNYSFRKTVSLGASEHAREHLCNPARHRATWIDALNV